MVLLMQDKLDESAQAFEKALEMNPNDARNSVTTWEYLFSIWKTSWTNFFEKFLSNEPGPIRCINNSWYGSSTQWSFRQGCETYQVAIAKNPSDPRAHNNLGTVFQKLGNFESARRAFETAIKVDNEYLDTFFNLGLLQKKTGYFEAAITCLKKFISGNPQHVGALCTLGNCFERNGRFHRRWINAGSGFSTR